MKTSTALQFLAGLTKVVRLVRSSKLTLGGELTTLYSFCSESNTQFNCTDGEDPEAGLVQATNGNFYGTTSKGGSNGTPYGTVFEITAAGKLTTLHSFCSTINHQGYCADGAVPIAGLVQATNGNFYGTTEVGGTNNDGTVFEITAAGKLTTLLSFNGTHGAQPYAALVQATNGNFYGTTLIGGDSNACPLMVVVRSSKSPPQAS
jgi:uncharacterized repeat protein (TIGR03803 family)